MIQNTPSGWVSPLRQPELLSKQESLKNYAYAQNLTKTEMKH